MIENLIKQKEELRESLLRQVNAAIDGEAKFSTASQLIDGLSIHIRLLNAKIEIAKNGGLGLVRCLVNRDNEVVSYRLILSKSGNWVWIIDPLFSGLYGDVLSNMNWMDVRFRLRKMEVMLPVSAEIVKNRLGTDTIVIKPVIFNTFNGKRFDLKEFNNERKRLSLTQGSQAH